MIRNDLEGGDHKLTDGDFLWQGKRTNGTVAGLDHGSRDPRVGLLAMRVEIHYPYPLT